MRKLFFTKMGIKGKKDRLYLVNGVAYIEADLSLAHLRILMAIIKALQGPILFSVVKNNKVPVEKRGIPRGEINGIGAVRILRIPVPDFNMPQNNHRLRACLDEMRSVSCVFSEDCHFKEIIVGYQYTKFSRHVDVYIREEFARRLLFPTDGYFYFYDGDTDAMTNKYIIRVYWLVCSWRSRGGFVIKVDDFRKIMGITQRYTRIDNIISKIIVPSQKYMRENFPLWFEYRFHDEPKGKLFAFKLKEELSEEEKKDIVNAKSFYFFNILSSYGVKLDMIEKFLALVKPEDYGLLDEKMSVIKDYLLSHPDIRDKGAYFISALCTWYDNWLEMFGNPLEEDIDDSEEDDTS